MVCCKTFGCKMIRPSCKVCAQHELHPRSKAALAVYGVIVMASAALLFVC